MQDKTFGEWLDQTLEKKGWTRADLSRVARVSESHLSRIATQGRGVGPEKLRAIADALEIDQVTLFRKVGWLSPGMEEVRQSDRQLDWACRLFEQLSPHKREAALDMLSGLAGESGSQQGAPWRLQSVEDYQEFVREAVKQEMERNEHPALRTLQAIFEGMDYDEARGAALALLELARRFQREESTNGGEGRGDGNSDEEVLVPGDNTVSSQ